MRHLYRVLIIDDETISRMGIRSLINWEEYGYEVIGEADNGKVALDMAKKYKPHLIITDIKMPVMDGIELIKNIKKEDIKCEIFVLSSYDDFYYVKEALKLGAKDYLLKLELEPEELIRQLQETKQILDNRIEIQKEDNIVNYREEEKTYALRQQVLRDLLYGKPLDLEETMQHLKECKVNLEGRYFVVLLIKLDVKKNEILWRKEAVNNLFEEILTDYNNTYLSSTGVDEISILHEVKARGSYQQRQDLLKMSNRILKVLRQFLNLDTYVTISSVQKSIQNIPLAYLQAYQAYKTKHMFSKGVTIFYEDILISKSIGNYSSMEGYILQLEQAIKTGELRHIEEATHTIISDIRKMEYFEVNQLKYILSSIIYTINRNLVRSGIETKGLWGDNGNIYLALDRLTVKNDFIDWFNTLYSKIENLFNDINQQHIFILKMKKMVEAQYDHDIRVHDIAENLGVSPNYLSHLFKKQTGQSFKNYLTNFRIEKAKELLRHTTYNIAEIAPLVGYDNEHYFSRVFKQKTGKTPSSYRGSGKVHLS